MSLSLHFAQAMWGHSNQLLDVMLGASEIEKGRPLSSTFDQSLKVIVDELSSWDLASKKKFRENLSATWACQAVLRRRDGYEAWNKGKTLDDLYEACFLEYQNLQKLLVRSADANAGQAKKFCILLNDWSMGEVVSEQRERQQERHPLRRYVA